MDGELAPSAVALLRDDDGWPTLACRWIGAGRLAVFTADLSPGNSDLVKGPLFVPLLHQLVRGLTPGPPAPGITHPGDSPVFMIDGLPHHRNTNDRLAAYGPDNQPVRFSTSDVDEDHRTIQLEPVQHIGRYRIVHREAGTLLGDTYVELDPAESDLRTSDQHSVSKDASHETPVAAAGDWKGPNNPLRPDGAELWPYLITAAVLLIALEVLATQWFVARGNASLEGEPNHA